MKALPRGIRNRNPGNIRRSGDRWKGLAPLQSDPAFFVFETPLWGIRAMAVILRNYQRRHGLKSLAQIVGRWAPAGENDTAGYVAAVSKAMGVEPRAPARPAQRCDTALTHRCHHPSRKRTSAL